MHVRAVFFSILFGVWPAGPLLAACDDVLATGNAYNNYSAVAEKLLSGDDPASIGTLECFLPGALDGLDANAAYQRLIATSFEPNVLYDYLKDEARSVFKKARNQKGDSGALAWRGGYVAEAAMTAYERTGDTRFLDLFVRYFDEVLEFRDSELGITDRYHNRVMASWSEHRRERMWFGPLYLRVELPVAHITHAARITLAASRFIEFVSSDPALERYKPAAERYLEASLAALAEFEEDRKPIDDAGLAWFVRPMTGEAEPTNHIHTLGSVYINLAEVTGDAEMKRRVEEIVEVFERGVTTAEDGTVHWQYFPYFSDADRPNGLEFSEPIWKASQTAPFLYRAYAAGYPVPDDLVAAIAKTFMTHIVRDDEILRNVSPVGSDVVEADDDRLSNLNGIVTWLEFSPREPEIAERIREVVGARPDLFPGGWLSSANSARGYAFFLGNDRAENAAGL